ncbi:MAG: hypothetical protein P9L94_15265 [Candidatus Hinthialibacter antarcticus]|nr:hypothetical protein [Candidatus Hinthialibacter antarcticus]
MNDNIEDDSLDFDVAADQISTSLMAAQLLEKARSEGIPMKDLALMSQGGRTRAVTAKEKERSSNIRRKELVDLMRKRTIRGDQSLVNDIIERISNCQSKIDIIVQHTEVSPQEMVAVRRELEGSQNRASSLAKDVQVLEQAIVRKKKEDPVIRQFEEASAALLTAMQEKDVEQIKKLRMFCEKTMKQYNINKRRLKPYIEKAREARLKFIVDKRRIMRIQFQTLMNIMEIYATSLNTGGFQHYTESATKEITDSIHTLRHMRSDAQARMDKLGAHLGNIPLSFITDIEKDLDVVDEIILKPIIGGVEALILVVQSADIESLKTKKEDKVVSKESKRMAYQEKEDKKK